MITVSISINREPIFTRTAVNRTAEYYKSKRIRGCGSVSRKDTKDKGDAYVLDDGSWVIHKPEKGAVKLAIKMLKAIKEQK
jgi:hypothetical protein